jgi:DNA-binding GntR family transcriptional regulator
MAGSTRLDLSGRADKRTLREQARLIIRSGIVTGLLIPGEMYTVGQLAEQIGVSVTPVREALMDLGSQGLIEVMANRGVRVPILTHHDLNELFELRVMLEVTALEQLALTATPADLQPFREVCAKNQEYAEAGDIRGFLETDRQFHLGLIGLLGNGRLVKFVDELRDLVRIGTVIAAEFAEEHSRLLDAIEARDSALTREIMMAHLVRVRASWNVEDDSVGNGRA